MDTNSGLIAFGAAGHGNSALDEVGFPGISSALSSGVVAVTTTARYFAVWKCGGTVFAWGPSFLGEVMRCRSHHQCYALLCYKYALAVTLGSGD